MIVKNKLNALIQAKKLDADKKIKIRDIEEDIASYCGIARETVVSIKRENMIPSLGVALKISEYFNTSVNKIFYMEE